MVQEIKVIIADDEPLARETIKTYLGSRENVTVLKESSNGLEALRDINDLRPDLVFLDIQMPELNGFEVLREIDLKHLPVIVFATAYDKYALNAFEANAVDYLLKPFNQMRFDAALNKAEKFILGESKEDGFITLKKLIKSYDGLQNLSHEASKYITRILVKEHKKYFFVKTEDVQWFEANGDYVILHKEKGTHWMNDSLSSLETKLDPAQFIRIHRSTILNVNSIQDLQPYFNGEFHISLKNGDKVKLSRHYKDKIRQLFDGATFN